jgi:hypothetical protein
MSRYNLSWRDTVRFQYATSQSRRDLCKLVCVLLVILLGYGIVGRIDYEMELQDEAAHYASAAYKAEQMLLACMNGSARFMNAEQTVGVSCRKAEDFKL